MKRLFFLILPVLFIFPLKGMDLASSSNPADSENNHAIALQGRRVDVAPKSIFDKVPQKLAYFLYGLPEFFSVKHQLYTYGIATGDDQYAPLDQSVQDEVLAYLKETTVNPSEILIMQLNAQQQNEAFVVTNGCIFIDQAWWQSIDTDAGDAAAEVKKFFITLMAEQFEKGQYRKHLATKILVDGVIVSAVIGIATYTIAPIICSWMASNVPGTTWLENMSTGIAATANSTCDQFYSPSLCIAAGKTAWSSILAPGVGPALHAVLSAPVARYLALKASSKALASVADKTALAAYCAQMKESGKGEQYDQLLTVIENGEDE